ncbi:MAG: hypothetical protein ABI461_13560, partial [Polyangiaceae bacterium]
KFSPIMTHRSPAAATTTPRLSGSILLEQIQIATKEYGEEAIARAKASLPEKTRAALADLLTITWIETAMAQEIKDTIAREVGQDPIAFQKWVVRSAIGGVIGKFWRVLLARVSDGAIVKRAPIIYSKTFDVGRLEVTTFDGRAATLRVVGWNDMPDYDAIGLAAGIEAVLEYAGRKGARVTFARSGEIMGFSLTWDA